MKDYWWKIKVSDLLKEPWSTDVIKFNKKFLKTDDVILTNEWIGWKIFIQWLNHDEIFVKIKNIKFNVSYVCDKCWKEYIKIFDLKEQEEVRFINENNIKIEWKVHDEVFPIDMKNQNIDIEELIEIIVKNQEPIIKNCWKCKNKILSEEKKSQEEYFTYNIDFSKLLKS